MANENGWQIRSETYEYRNLPVSPKCASSDGVHRWETTAIETSESFPRISIGTMENPSATTATGKRTCTVTTSKMCAVCGALMALVEEKVMTKGGA